jgi:hypothetical protein
VKAIQTFWKIIISLVCAHICNIAVTFFTFLDEDTVGRLFVDISLPPFRRKLRDVALKRDLTSELTTHPPIGAQIPYCLVSPNIRPLQSLYFEN